MNRALLVGINKYHGAPLNGCVNDVNDMANFIVEKCAYSKSEVRLLVDGRATTNEIKTRLQWLIQGVRSGDRLLFHYSGHGAQVATRDSASEIDGLDEVICPVDFDWSDEHLIRDKYFNALFNTIPDNVQFLWISDSCHSGDLLRDMPPKNVTYRTMPPPMDIKWRIDAAKANKIAVSSLKAVAEKYNLALLSGCKSGQTSSDDMFNGRYNGALTRFLLDELASQEGLKAILSDLVVKVRTNLNKKRYPQEPQLDGNQKIMGIPFLHCL